MQDHRVCHRKYTHTPPQLWVFSTETKGQSTGNRELYNPTNSSSANLQRGSSWKISYGDGSGASGTVYTDSVKIGSVTADAQSVEVATTISPGAGGQGFSGTDGLLGLAASSINTVSPRQAKTWFDTVAPQLDERLFTATLKHQQPGSYVSLGQVSLSFFHFILLSFRVL